MAIKLLQQKTGQGKDISPIQNQILELLRVPKIPFSMDVPIVFSPHNPKECSYLSGGSCDGRSRSFI
jgi:hypothetical protein